MLNRIELNFYFIFMNYLLFVIGVAVLVFGVVKLIKSFKLSKNGIKMEAEIIEVRKKRESSTDSEGYSSTTDMYYPVYKYIYEGKEYSKESNVGVSRSRKYKVGEKMNIVFMGDDPQNAEVKSLLSLWIMPGVILLAGVLLLIYSFTGL